MRVFRAAEFTVPREAMGACVSAARRLHGWEAIGFPTGDTATVRYTCEDDVKAVGVWYNDATFAPILGITIADIPMDIPEKRPACERCDTHRHNNLYLLDVGNNGFQWVGETCMQKWELSSAAADVDRFPEETIFSIVRRGEMSPRVDTIAAIAEAYRTVDTSPAGYVSYAQAVRHGLTATSEVMRYTFDTGANNGTESEKYLLTAAAAQMWLAEHTPENDFEREVQYAASKPTVSFASFGLIAVIPDLYRKSEHATEAAEFGHATTTGAYADGYAGPVGERITANVYVEQIRSLEACFLVKMRTQDNLSLVWFTGKPGMREGETHTIKGTVKAHKEYQGVTSTQVNRCRVCPSPA